MTEPTSTVKFDSHSHITADEMYEDVDEVIERATMNRVGAIMNINTDRKTLERGLILQKKYPGIVYNAVATTPHDVESLGESDFEFFAKCIRKKQVHAVGETGLDYFYEHSDRKCQMEFLAKYFALAEEVNLPLIFHCRGDEAFIDLFALASSQKKHPAVLHCFTGTLEQAKKAIDFGWLISLSGIVTFKRSIELREVVKELPLDRLLIETDAPYLAPQSKRGRRNEPAFVSEVASVIAGTKGVSEEEVCKATYKNACAFFQILR